MSRGLHISADSARHGLGNFSGIITSFNNNEIIWAANEALYTLPVINTLKKND